MPNAIFAFSALDSPRGGSSTYGSDRPYFPPAEREAGVEPALQLVGKGTGRVGTGSAARSGTSGWAPAPRVALGHAPDLVAKARLELLRHRLDHGVRERERELARSAKGATSASANSHARHVVLVEPFALAGFQVDGDDSFVLLNRSSAAPAPAPTSRMRSPGSTRHSSRKRRSVLAPAPHSIASACPVAGARVDESGLGRPSLRQSLRPNRKRRGGRRSARLSDHATRAKPGPSHAGGSRTLGTRLR